MKKIAVSDFVKILEKDNFSDSYLISESVDSFSVRIVILSDLSQKKRCKNGIE